MVSGKKRKEAEPATASGTTLGRRNQLANWASGTSLDGRGGSTEPTDPPPSIRACIYIKRERMFVLYVFVLYITFFFKHAQFDLEVYAPRKEKSDQNWMAVFLFHNHTLYSNQDNTKNAPNSFTKTTKKPFRHKFDSNTAIMKP